MVILLKALCITYEVFFNFKAFHVCGLSNVPWISCAKYLLFDDKREIYVSNSCIHFDYDHFRLENKLQPVSKNHFFLALTSSKSSAVMSPDVSSRCSGCHGQVTCHVSHAAQCDVRGAGGAGGGGGLRHLPSSIASPPPAGNCSVLTSAVKRSISFTIGFHNHGEGSY